MSAPTVSPELKALLRRVKLGRCLDTLPERLALAQTGGMDTPSSSSSSSRTKSPAGKAPPRRCGPVPRGSTPR
jgi:hypothetical protein